MSQGTYIGQAQINTQIEDTEGYGVGDIVVWKSDLKGSRYLVEGFLGEKVVLVPIGSVAWRPNREWFVKEDG